MFVLCFQSLQMNLLEGCSLIVKLDVVPDTMVSTPWMTPGAWGKAVS